MSDTSPPTDGTPPADTPPPESTDWKAEAEKWKALADQTEKRAKSHEDKAKANAAAAKELEALRQQSMSDIDKAVAVAKTEVRLATLREVGGQLVTAEIRAAAAGRGVDVDALVEGIDPARFLGDDAQPDRKAIVAWVDRIAPPGQKPGFPDLGQGARGGGNDMALNGDPLLRDIKAKLGM